MHLYTVGKPYSSRTRWPELAQYNYRGGDHELVLFLNNSTPSEIRDVGKGEAQFALYVERSLIIMLYKFGKSIPWSDAPFSIHLVPADQRILPPPVTGDYDGALLHILLVDASNGILKAMRALSLSAEFTTALHHAITEQAKMPFSQAAYNKELNGLYAGYSSDELAQMAPIHYTSIP